MDALTGQDLNRWFPLTSPSDFLFFLPPRQNVDSAKKLRLISSAARLCEQTELSSRLLGVEAQASTFWQRLGGDLDPGCHNRHMTSRYHDRDSDRYASRHTRRGRFDNTNHFRAVPVGDGHHILFTDPASGCLCLGSDAPIGGPTKLLRKIWLEGPQDSIPLVYASGSNLSWGVRIAAVYGTGDQQSLWFFSVPLDIFAAEQSQTSSTNPLFKTKARHDRNNDMEWRAWLGKNNSNQEPLCGASSSTSSEPDQLWPVKIRGQYICNCEQVVGLAVDSGPDMVIWTFGSNGLAMSWRFDDGKSLEHQAFTVMPDGTIRARDNEGDISMDDASELYHSASDLISYDGTTTLNESASAKLDDASALYGSSLTPSSSPWSPYRGRYVFEHLSWTILESGSMNQTAHRTTGERGRVATDFIARLDVDIH